MAKPNVDNITLFFDYGIDPTTKTLYLGSAQHDDNNNEEGVNYLLAERVIKGLHILDSNNVDKPINILMNTIGGCTYSALAIYDKIKSCKSPVIITVFGQVLSAGVYILQAADERNISKNSTFMMHAGEVEYSGHPKTVQAWQKFEEKQDEIFLDILLEKIKEKHPKFSKHKLKLMMDFDTVMSAEEVTMLGLADKVIE